MRSFVLVAALYVGACWTGSTQTVEDPNGVPPPAPAGEPMKLRVKLERTACFGTCPTYTLIIGGSGAVEWNGTSNVAAPGHRSGRVQKRDLEELSRRLDRARFFERDQFGELPKEPECTRTGNSTSCSFSTSVSICSDTSHTIITVVRDGEAHKIDNDHCNETPELDELEEYIDRVAHTSAWIRP
jgi:hypothetical protein